MGRGNVKGDWREKVRNGGVKIKSVEGKGREGNKIDGGWGCLHEEFNRRRV